MTVRFDRRAKFGKNQKMTRRACKMMLETSLSML
jgi:hypothetical protein